MSEPVFKYKGKLYSQEYWNNEDYLIPNEDDRTYVGDVDELICTLERDNKARVHIEYRYELDGVDGFSYDLIDLLTKCGSSVGVELVDCAEDGNDV